MWYLYLCLKFIMVAPIPRWKYTLSPVPRCLAQYFSRNVQLPDTFTPQHIIVISLTLCNKITQLWIILANIEAVWHQQPYLHGKKFIEHMDHRPLTYFFAQPNLSLHPLCWTENLANFLPWYSIQYTQGSANILPDAISQYPDFLTSLTMDTAM